MISNDSYSEMSEDSRSVSLLDRIYTFTVISIAFVAISLAVWPDKDARSYVVETVWSYTRQAADQTALSEEEIDKIKYAIKSPDAIRTALQIVSPSVDENRYSAWQQAVAESVSVVVEPDIQPGDVRVRVRAGGNNEVFCKELIATLQEQFHQGHHKPADSQRIAQARKRVEQGVVAALKSLDMQQSALEKHLQDQMERARSSAANRPVEKRTSSLPDKPSAPIATLSPAPALAQVEFPNPDYADLQREIAVLESQSIVLGSPSQNPQAAAAKYSLEALRARLRTTPASKPEDGNWTENPYSASVVKTRAGETRDEIVSNPYANNAADAHGPSPDAPSNANHPPTAKTAAVELARNSDFDAYAVEQSIRNSREFRKLQERLEIAKRKHDAALDILAKIPNLSAVPSQEVELLQPPTVVSQFYSSMDSSSLWTCLVPACLLGLICAVFSAREKAPNTFYSAADVGSSLNLPVVGSITTERGPVIRGPVKTQRQSVRRIRHAAEIALVASLIVIIFALATNDGYAELIAGDPFAGFMTAAEHTKSLILKTDS